MPRYALIMTALLSILIAAVCAAEAGSGHPWHDIEPCLESPGVINVVIEIPKDSKNKYEMDKKTGLLTLDRVLSSSVHYPTNYGFIPRSYQEDGDPLDVLVLAQYPIYPLASVRVKAIGLMHMKDEGESDTKIIAVPVKDMQYARYTDISQLPEHLLKEIKLFFQEYKALDDKKVVVEGFGGAAEAYGEMKKALQLYNDNVRMLRKQ